MTAPGSDPRHGQPRDTQVAEAGRAMRWSVMTLLLVLAAILLLLLINREPPPPVRGAARPDGVLPPSPDSIASAVPGVLFRDVTAESGLRFAHRTGARGEKFLPETMGAGCAFVDVDSDGDPDLIFVDSAAPLDRVADQAVGGEGAGAASRTDRAAALNLGTSALVLYLNDGRGHFHDATAGSGLETARWYGMAVAAGDFDNDRRVDLCLAGIGGIRMFHNLGAGRFADVTREAGVEGQPEDWATSAAWFDYDRDGDLDLFVCRYVRWSPELDRQVNYQLPGIGRAYGPPLNFPGTFPQLFRNNGRGHFEEVSAASGLQLRNAATGLPLAKSLGVAPVDVNEDGWMDVIVANDTVQNFVFTNRHDGTYREVGAVAGVAFDAFGGTRGAMGIDVARFAEENALGISIGNFANEMTAFYVARRGELTFADEAIARGIGHASRLSLTFGVFFFDYDLDGQQDLLTVNGHLEEQIGRIQPGQSLRQPAQLFWNGAAPGQPAAFTLVPAAKCGAALLEPRVGRGSAYADIDGDGDLDVVLTQNGGPAVLLRNELGSGANWLRLRLVGRHCPADAIGAWVHVRAGTRSMWRHVMPTRGYLSQSELPVTFGLGTATSVEEVTVHWPDGSVQRLPPPPLRTLTVVEQAP